METVITSYSIHYTKLYDRADEFFEEVQKLNFRKMDAITGETAELDDDDEDPDSLDEHDGWNR